MIRKLLYFLIFTALFLPGRLALCQTQANPSLKILPRYSFYSYEKKGEFLLHTAPSLYKSNLSVSIRVNSEIITSWNGIANSGIIRIPFTIDLSPSEYTVEAEIISSSRPGVRLNAYCNLIILPFKPNEVKTDRLTGGVIVNRRQFFPFGFYCYSPVDPQLPEDEVVRGFNMMSPYQKILPGTLNERKAYMDRCAEIGMKVHYNLLSVSGGGGVGSKIEELGEQEKRKLLLAEINTFKDHPALLAWYIADEPNGNRISPGVLEEICRTVRKNDPWHPVSIVLMAPFSSARKYIKATDIIMADPYPVPDNSITMPGDVAGRLVKEFKGENPVWMVPQAFGGGELWSREPTSQELRSMTWQAIISGATGIQYFVRQGPNYFPKSPSAWAECGRIAAEVAELTPWLLSDEETVPVTSAPDGISVSSRYHNGRLLIMAVNRVNVPTAVSIKIPGISKAYAALPFENRSVKINGGTINDHISAFGSQAYIVDIKPRKPEITAQGRNLLKDPGFEDSASPGIPSACYTWTGGDKGATYFLDSREHFEGDHSLRIITPKNDKSVSVKFFPFSVRAGVSYSVSVWAKSDPDQRISSREFKTDITVSALNRIPQYVEVRMGDFGRARFVPDGEWRRYMTFFTIPDDTLPVFKTNLILKMPGHGVAWFDRISVTEDVVP
jgi:hypothetical protein